MRRTVGWFYHPKLIAFRARSMAAFHRAWSLVGSPQAVSKNREIFSRVREVSYAGLLLAGQTIVQLAYAVTLILACLVAIVVVLCGVVIDKVAQRLQVAVIPSCGVHDEINSLLQEEAEEHLEGQPEADLKDQLDALDAYEQCLALHHDSQRN